MIKHLYIKNFVLIDELNLDFESGFSAFTGETGAGKSILIDALSLLSSERASASFVMKGKDKAVIEGTFDLSGNPHAAKVLQEAGLDLNEETTFTREISASGKSVIRIDRRIATLSLMKDCLRYEIDIHGQRDNQYLLSTANHIRLLDEYISAGELTNKMHEAFRRYDSLRKEKEKALTETYNENDLEYFRYQVSEIEEADLKEGEDEELAEKEKNFKAMQNSFSKVSQFFALYDESVSDGLYQMNRIVSTLPENDQITQVQTAVNDAYYAVADAAERLHQIYDDVEMSEEEINRMEERLFTIQKLKRKYGRTIPEIMERRDELLNRIEAIENRQSYIDRISRKVNQAFQEFTDAAVEVSKIRHDQSAELDDKVRQSLLDLKLEHARFHTSVTEGEPSVNGIDKVEFMISMNPGEELKPLSKTASGGELSRLMLGLKEIFSRLQGIQTVIFDEIDTGVSGPVASAIGRKMKQLSASCQVFSVTHLAQVASFADQNYLVSKSVQDDVTRTEVHQMNRDEIITQLALIASGVLTESSLQAAKELYGRNHG